MTHEATRLDHIDETAHPFDMKTMRLEFKIGKNRISPRRSRRDENDENLFSPFVFTQFSSLSSQPAS